MEISDKRRLALRVVTQEWITIIQKEAHRMAEEIPVRDVLTCLYAACTAFQKSIATAMEMADNRKDMN